jgi:hypothetical protein
MMVYVSKTEACRRNTVHIYVIVHFVGAIKDVCDNRTMQETEFFEVNVLFCEVMWD